jgi:hypothetical protein
MQVFLVPQQVDLLHNCVGKAEITVFVGQRCRCGLLAFSLLGLLGDQIGADTQVGSTPWRSGAVLKAAHHLTPTFHVSHDVGEECVGQGRDIRG